MPKATQVGSSVKSDIDFSTGFASSCCGPSCKSTNFRPWGIYWSDSGQRLFACCRVCGESYYNRRSLVRLGIEEDEPPSSLAEVIKILQAA